MDFLLIFSTIIILDLTHGLLGPNVCSEVKQYILTTKIKYQQPVIIRSYTWCFNIPPKCSVVRTEMREKWKVQTENRTQTITFCCPGFIESNDKCTPKCPKGVTGDKCDEDCPLNKWGTSCHQDCKCPKNSICDPKNGMCICIDGWIGSSCDILKSAFTRKPHLSTESKITKTLFDWSTPYVSQTAKPNTTIIYQQPKSTKSTALSVEPLSRKYNLITSTTTLDKEITTTKSTTTQSSLTSSDTQSSATTIGTAISDRDEIKNDTAIKESILVLVTQDHTTSLPQTTARPTDQTIDSMTTQIESPVTTSKPVAAPQVTDSPITVILKKNVKEPKTVPNATETSIISLTVLKSTASTARRKIHKYNKPDSDLVKITLNSLIGRNGKTLKTSITSPSPNDNQWNLSIDPLKKISKNDSYEDITVAPLMSTNQPFIYTIVTTDIQTEEIMHVLTEPEQITSVAGEEDTDERRDDLYSALSIAMGIAAAIILVATIIVLVARYRKGSNGRTKKIDMNNVQTILNASEEELPSSYIRSVFHSPIPDLPMNTLPYIHDNKSRYSVPFMQPVVIHAVSPIMVENFRDILECHYDHPKPLRPTNFTTPVLAQQRCVTFSALPTNYCDAELPVTEESINTLKLEHHTMQTFEMESTEPVYDEIPWCPLPARANQIITMGDEAVTEL